MSIKTKKYNPEEWRGRRKELKRYLEELYRKADETHKEIAKTETEIQAVDAILEFIQQYGDGDKNVKG